MRKACDVYGTTKGPIVPVKLTIEVDGEAQKPWTVELSSRGLERLYKFIQRGTTPPQPLTLMS